MTIVGDGVELPPSSIFRTRRHPYEHKFPPPPPLVEPRTSDFLRLTTIILSLALLVACGGGGGGNSTAIMTPTTGNPNTPPTGGGGGGNVNPLADLADFMPTANSSSIRAVQNIINVTDVSIDISDSFQEESLGNDSSARCSSQFCSIELPGSPNTLAFLKDNLADLSLVRRSAFFSNSNYSSEITNGTVIEGIEGITFARGNLTGMRAADSTPLEFETFAGWLNGSVFGTIQVSIGLSAGEQYRFISYGAGVYTDSTSSPAPNPTAIGSETTSARWEGATVASIKASREFIFGDATITVNFTDTNVDLEFDNWRNLNNQELSNMAPITYEDVGLGRGRFSLRKNSNFVAFGRFYGTDHAEVGGWFNTEDVTGAFGGTRQEAQ